MWVLSQLLKLVKTKLELAKQLDFELEKLNTDIGAVAFDSDEQLEKEFEECDSYDRKVIDTYLSELCYTYCWE